MIKDNKGSTSVFLVCILASMMVMIMALVSVAGQKAIESYGDGLLNLAARSVMTEYDRDLKRDYGLIGFYGPPHEIEEKIIKYTDYTLSKKKRVKAGEINAGISGYSLMDVDTFEKQVISYTKYALAKGLIKKATGSDSDTVTGDNTSNVVLRNSSVSEALPSHVMGYENKGLGGLINSIKNSLSSLENIFKDTADTALLNEYILMHFKSRFDNPVKHDTLFTNEVEYILEGDLSDETNKKGVRKTIIRIRTVVNLGYIYTSRKKRAETMAMAELLTPGPEAVLTQAAIAAAWARAESENDMAVLEHRKRIPFPKTEASWATDLESVIKGGSKGYIDTGSKTGMDYTDHLRLFLHVQNREVKIARTMDLIQINMKGNYNRNFLIDEYNTGFDLKSRINGRDYVYKEMY